jgi:hypothetical protein
LVRRNFPNSAKDKNSTRQGGRRYFISVPYDLLKFGELKVHFISFLGDLYNASFSNKYAAMSPDSFLIVDG